MKENNFEKPAAKENLRESRDDYYEKSKGREPRPILIFAASLCQNKEEALDLGAGNLIESKYLLEEGFKHVTAVDRSPKIEVFKDEIKDPGLEVKRESFADFEFSKEKYDLINAQFSLPFYGEKDFPAFMEKIINSLKPGGVFAGHLFGKNDGWNVGGSGMAFHTKEEIEALFQGVEVIRFKEMELDGKESSGKLKHWHIFTFVVRKKA